MVLDGSGGTATAPLAGAAGAGADVGGASWPTSGCLAASVGVLVVFLVVFFAVAVPGALVDFEALSFFRQALRELEVLRLWQ